MPNLFNASTQSEIMQRINNLSASSQRKWGKMSVSQMLKHMTTAFAVPIEKIQVPREPLYYVVANPIARWMMIKAMTKWPKNMMTAQAFLVKEDIDFEPAKKSFLETYQAFLQASSFNGSHPIFGTMSKELWGDAMYIHLNHHLEQFGV
ncbi:MAG: DUF1569 domain-containing protein [Chitinophagales bacterium]|nr:MAG: DUF1569 domain-containing protein [Bacteroidia bacterium]